MSALPATEHHPHARAVLGAALRPGGTPSHAYLFQGPAGTGKRRAARELASVLLGEGAPDPDGVRVRVEHGTHPDLTWVTPSGAHEMLVGDIEDAVVSAASRTPFEATRRVFVLERADTLVEAAANKLLKTLEEPPPYATLVLLTDRPDEVLPTIVSRCQPVRFDALAPAALAAELEDEGIDATTAVACARLALGDGQRARELADEEGAALRRAAEGFARACLRGQSAGSWEPLLAEAARRGDRVRAELAAEGADAAELVARRDRRRLETEYADRSRRAKRREETAALDLGLGLVSHWLSDVAAVVLGAPKLVHHADRPDEITEDSAGRDPLALRDGIELVEETRQRLLLNVSEALACEALAHRLGARLAS